MKIFLMFLAFLFICSHKTYSQDRNKKHSVKKGETVYRISKIYNVSVEGIFALNPNSKEVIYVNDVLIIPIPNGDTIIASPEETSKTATKNLNDTVYVVKKGDTKYGLSKKFGITIAQLEQNNSHIINGLQTGHSLNLNTSHTVNSVQYKNPKEYLVKKGDTKYGLSKKFGITIAQLEQKNPHIINGLKVKQLLILNSSENRDVEQIQNPRKYLVKKGDTKYGLSKIFNTTIGELESINPEITKMLHYGITINIPQSSKDSIQNNSFSIDEISNNTATKVTVKNSDEPNQEDTKKTIPVETDSDNNNETTSDYTDLRLTINTSNSRKILLVLPFTEVEYEVLVENTKIVDDSFLIKNIEFYKGAKRAIDMAKNLGLNIEIDILKINHNNSEKSDLYFKPDLSILESYDGILSPFFQNETELISESVINKNIPIITLHPVSLNNKSNNIYEALPSKKIQKLKLLEYLNAKKGNIVLISDSKRGSNRSIVLEHSPSANIVEVRKQGENLKSELVLALDKQKTNYVIIDSQRNSVFLSSTNLLLKEISDYAVQLAVLETSLIPNEKNLSSKRFKVLNLIYPALNNKNVSDSKISETPNNIDLGYDITFDTLLRISQSISFETSAKQDKTEYGTLNIDYQKEGSGSYKNNDVFILEFNKIESIKPQND